MTNVPQNRLHEQPPSLFLPGNRAIEVVGEDGRLGHVRRVLPSWHGATPTHLVVEAEEVGLVVLPLDQAKDITPQRITVRMRRRQLRRLPQLRSDAELAAEISAALSEAPMFRRRDDLDVIDVRVIDGVAELQGNARSLLRALHVEQVAEQVNGVVDVRNKLIIDDDLARTAAAALTHEPRLHLDELCISAVLGVVHIRARAGSITDCAGVLLAVQPIAGLRGVEGEFELARASTDPGDLPRQMSLHWRRPLSRDTRHPNHQHVP